MRGLLKRYKVNLFYAVLLATALAFYPPLFAQQLVVVKKSKAYSRHVQTDTSFKMIEIKSMIPDIVYDLRYFYESNFTKTRLYTQNKVTFMRLPVVKALRSVQDTLKQQGYGLKIFDAYRPYSVTKKMWELIHDERYVANPARGSGHNRGIAVDLTLIDLKTGKELDMGTDFDNFTDTAHHSFQSLPLAVLRNRKLLKDAMEGAGFRAFETEWWHYSWPNNKDYPVMDLDFKVLNKLAASKQF